MASAFPDIRAAERESGLGQGVEKTFTGNTGRIVPLAEPKTVDDWFGAVGGAIALQPIYQTIGRTYEMFQGKEEAGYDPFSPSEIEGYERYASEFIGVSSRADAIILKERIDRNNARRGEIADHLGLGGMLLSELFNPINLVPLPGLRGAGLLKGVLKGTAGFAGLLTAEEIMRQGVDPTATTAESIDNVVYGTIFGAIIGGGVGAFTKTNTNALTKRYIKETEQAEAGVFNAIRRDGSLDEAYIPSETGFTAMPTGGEASGVAKVFGLEKITQMTTWGQLKATKIRALGDIADGLVGDFGTKSAQNVAGPDGYIRATENSASLAAGRWRGIAGDISAQLQEIYARYRSGGTGTEVLSVNLPVAGGQIANFFGVRPPDGKMSFEEFKDAVFRAHKADKIESDNPFVLEGVTASRVIFDKAEVKGTASGVIKTKEGFKAEIARKSNRGRAILARIDEIEAKETITNSDRAVRRELHRAKQELMDWFSARTRNELGDDPTLVGILDAQDARIAAARQKLIDTQSSITDRAGSRRANTEAAAEEIEAKIAADRAILADLNRRFAERGLSDKQMAYRDYLEAMLDELDGITNREELASEAAKKNAAKDRLSAFLNNPNEKRASLDGRTKDARAYKKELAALKAEVEASEAASIDVGFDVSKDSKQNPIKVDKTFDADGVLIRVDAEFVLEDGKKVDIGIHIDEGKGWATIGGDSVNKLGPKEMLRFAYQLAKAVPELTQLHGGRVTGARKGKRGSKPAVIDFEALRNRKDYSDNTVDADVFVRTEKEREPGTIRGDWREDGPHLEEPDFADEWINDGTEPLAPDGRPWPEDTNITKKNVENIAKLVDEAPSSTAVPEIEIEYLKRVGVKLSVKDYLARSRDYLTSQRAVVVDEAGNLWELNPTTNPSGDHAEFANELWSISGNVDRFDAYVRLRSYGDELAFDYQNINQRQIQTLKQLKARATREGANLLGEIPATAARKGEPKPSDFQDLDNYFSGVKFRIQDLWRRKTKGLDQYKTDLRKVLQNPKLRDQMTPDQIALTDNLLLMIGGAVPLRVGNKQFGRKRNHVLGQAEFSSDTEVALGHVPSVAVRGLSGKKYIQTLLHEAVHIAYIGKFDGLMRGADHVSPKAMAVRNDLTALFTEARGRPDWADNYGMKDLDEFMAEALTNPEFQTWLKDGGLWNRIVDHVRQIFGLDKRYNNLLAEVLEIADDLRIEGEGINPIHLMGRGYTIPGRGVLYNKKGGVAPTTSKSLNDYQTVRERAYLDILQKRLDGFADEFQGPKNEANYLTRFWLIDDVLADEAGPQVLRATLRKWFQDNPLEGASTKPERIEARVDDALASITKEAQLGEMQLMKPSTSSALFTKSRKLDIPNELVFDFIETDIDKVIRTYAARFGTMHEMAAKFGEVDATDAISDAMIQTAREIDATDLGSAYAKIDELRGKVELLRDDTTGRIYSQEPAAMSKRRTAGLLRAWGVTTMLGGAALSAIPELARGMMAHGFSRSFGTIANGAFDRASWGKVSKEMRELTGEGIDTVTSGTMSRFVEQGGPTGAATSKLGRAAHKFTDFGNGLFFVANGLAMITDITKRMNLVFTNQFFLEDIGRMVTGNAPQELVERMASYGINMEDAIAISKQPIQQEGRLLLANVGEWSDDALGMRYSSAVAGMVRRIIPTAGKADIPQIAKGFIKGREFPLLTMPFQFMQYGFASTNKVALSALQGRDQSPVIGVAALIGLGYMTASIKTNDYYWEKMPAAEKFTRSVDYSGITGIFSDVNTMVETATLGNVGLRPLMGVDPYNRDNDTLGMVAEVGGPVPGKVSDIVRLFVDDDVSPSDISGTVRRSIPLNQLFYWKNQWRDVERSIMAKDEPD